VREIDREKCILPATPKFDNTLGKWIVEVMMNGERLPLGRMIDSLFFKYLKFDTKGEAIRYIKNDSRLELNVLEVIK
jgi:hypothetical protein